MHYRNGREAKNGDKIVQVLEPILVRPVCSGPNGDRSKECYELVAGERRLKAAQRAELKTIPALVRELSDKRPTGK